MPVLKNDSNIPLASAVYLAANSYDFVPNPRSLSATELCKSVRQVTLGRRITMAAQGVQGGEEVDLVELVASKFGSALHDNIERTWLDEDARRTALASLGYPKGMIDRVVVNPVVVKDGDIPVYLEQRGDITVGDWTVSGKFDFVGDGTLTDFKSTSVFTYINKTNDRKYQIQGSVYKVIHSCITQPTLKINFWFKDWSKQKALSDKKYPQTPVMEYSVPLMDEAETMKFISDFTRQLEMYEDAPEDKIPYCNQEDLWCGAPVYKYYKNPEKRERATKNFDDKAEAYSYQAYDQKGVGIVVEVPGKAGACKYCKGAPICSQYKSLMAAGQLRD